MAIGLSPLVRAVARLEEGLARYRRDTSDAQIRDGLIKRFEFTYDLSHKMLCRVMEQSAANPEEIERMSFPTLIRTAHEQGLTAGGWPLWRTFREMRNMTSRTYDEAKALAVVAEIPAFLAEAQDLLARLAMQSAV
jgi:nucleotidyltransferase substrate binding protein (TIGR01987 family)